MMGFYLPVRLIYKLNVRFIIPKKFLVCDKSLGM